MYNHRPPKEYTSFTALHVNARDFRRMSQYDELGILIDEGSVDYDVVFVSETWFDDCDAPNYGLPNYAQCFTSCRPEGGGGGVAVYVHSAVHLSSFHSRCSEDWSVQIVLVEIRRPGFEGFVIEVYSRNRDSMNTRRPSNHYHRRYEH